MTHLYVQAMAIRMRFALGDISETDAIAQLEAITEKMRRRLAYLEALGLTVPIVVVGGLIVLAIRLRTFG